MGKYIRVSILLLIFSLIAFSLTLVNKKENLPENIVGGDRDEHGCIGSAGYTWCEEKDKCLRIWEEPCDSIPLGQTLKCGMENCHGLEIECGPSSVEMCTEIYALGDRCRQYATCAIINSNCSQVENPKFTSCKKCVEDCMEKYATDSSMKVFECESVCE